MVVPRSAPGSKGPDNILWKSPFSELHVAQNYRMASTTSGACEIGKFILTTIRPPTSLFNHLTVNAATVVDKRLYDRKPYLIFPSNRTIRDSLNNTGSSSKRNSKVKRNWGNSKEYETRLFLLNTLYYSTTDQKPRTALIFPSYRTITDSSNTTGSSSKGNSRVNRNS